MKYAFIKAHCTAIPVQHQCRWFGLSRSGYYRWLVRQSSSDVNASTAESVDAVVNEAFKRNKGRYGSPRLTTELNESGFSISENTVAKSMRRQQLRAKAGRKYKVTTDSKHRLPVSENLLKQEFHCTAIGQKLCGDITYLWTPEGWLYLAVVLDLFSRKVVGWSINQRMSRSLVVDAMKMALSQYESLHGAIMHTDRGSQYCSYDFQKLLKVNGIRPSMSGKGNCYDNSCAESFFHSLKVEAVHGELIETQAKMQSEIFEYIELFYNTKRRHTALGNISPVQFELENVA